MAAIAFPQHAKSLTTSTGTTYSYVSIPPSSHAKPSLLFLHGFPSSCYDWRSQIAYFSSIGYGIIAPDLLGYGDTDRPTEAHAYRGKKMAEEIIELIDAEGFNESDKKLHGISHDWGVFLMSRLCNYYPGRWLSATFVSVPYMASGQDIDVDAINTMTKKMQGWETFGYWKFFEREDAGKIVADHFDSFYSILHAADPKKWIEHLLPIGALEAFLKADGKVDTGSYVTDQDKKTYSKIMNGNFNPAMNWYRCPMAGLNSKDENSMSPPLDPTLHMPVLFVESSHDPLSGNERVIQGMQAVIPNLTVKKIPAGHWVLLEKADEFNAILEDFVEGVDGKLKAQT